MEPTVIHTAPPRERTPDRRNTGERVAALRHMGATWPEVAEILGCPQVVAISALRATRV